MDALLLNKWQAALRKLYPSIILRENQNVPSDEGNSFVDVFCIPDNEMKAFTKFLLNDVADLGEKAAMPLPLFIPYSQSGTKTHYPEIYSDTDAFVSDALPYVSFADLHSNYLISQESCHMFLEQPFALTSNEILYSYVPAETEYRNDFYVLSPEFQWVVGKLEPFKSDYLMTVPIFSNEVSFIPTALPQRFNMSDPGRKTDYVASTTHPQITTTLSFAA